MCDEVLRGGRTNVTPQTGRFVSGTRKYIKVFCSYYKGINTYNYPAMLEGTISSGSNSEVNYKTNDVVYKTSNLIVINDGVHQYKGNSYLSIITMLKYEEK